MNILRTLYSVFMPEGIKSIADGRGTIMRSIEDVSAEKLAKLFHHYRGALAHDFACQSSEDGASSWDRASQRERELMVARLV